LNTGFYNVADREALIGVVVITAKKHPADLAAAGNWGEEMRVITYGQKANIVEHRLLVLLQRLQKHWTQQKNV
jgi:hypothetical protein